MAISISKKTSESNSNYCEKSGDFLTAYIDVKENGGQLYPGNGKDSANVVVRGKNVTVYWNPSSRRHAEVVQLCEFLNIDSFAMTGGRVARKLLNDILELPYKETFWNKKYRELAISGKHWHYYHIQPREMFYGVEFDLKSAYFASLSQASSLLYAEGRGYVDDNGALEAIKAISHNLPKWFRLQLLGCIASWRFSFLTKDKKNPLSEELVSRQVHKITFNAAFNAVHRAILRNYKIMQKIHEIGGVHIKRMHTDSFFLSWECPTDTEALLFEYLEAKKCEVTVKASGRAYFYDLNTGFVGRKFVGSKLDVTELMRSNGVKMQRTDLPPQVVDRFGHRLDLNPTDSSQTEKPGNSQETVEQLILFDT